MTLLLLVSMGLPPPRPDFQVLRVLYTSDLHCQTAPTWDFASVGLPRRRLGGWPGLYRLIEQERTDASLLLDCGDFAFGSPEADSSQGRLAVDFMNRLGYDAACLGARDFAGGMANVEALALAAAFPFLADPMLDVVLHRQVPLFRPCCVKVVGGMRVGIAGVTDPRIPALNRRDDAGELVVEPPLAQVRRLLPVLAAESAEVVIVAGHIDGAEALAIAESLVGVDLVICAGGAAETESRLSPGRSVPIVRTGVYGQRLGEVDVLFHRRERRVYQCEARVLNAEPVEVDTAVDWEWFRQARIPGSDSVVAAAGVEFGPDGDGRLGLALAAARAVAEEARADVAVIPLSAVEAGLAAGPVTRRELCSSFPYRDRLRLLSLAETLLRRVARPESLAGDWPAAAMHGADYFVVGDTARWPMLAQVAGPRLRERKGGPVKVVTTEWWLERTGLEETGRLLPFSVTDAWLLHAAANGVNRRDTVRLLAATAGVAPAQSPGLVNINTASSELLQTLPGVGPATAQRIIDHRSQHGRFQSVDDLDNVKGIGPKKLARLRPLVTVR